MQTMEELEKTNKMVEVQLEEIRKRLGKSASQKVSIAELLAVLESQRKEREGLTS